MLGFDAVCVKSTPNRSTATKAACKNEYKLCMCVVCDGEKGELCRTGKHEKEKNSLRWAMK